MNDTPKYPTDLFIGGAWRDGSRDKRIAVINPSDGSEIGRVANADAADAIAAVDAAANAAASWAATPPRKRSEILYKCFELMTRDAEALARLI
ncbi:aldehyde dehydrogenase, partial [Mesorhizobium sp. M7A.T.Ca.TU.009.01.3.2]